MSSLFSITKGGKINGENISQYKKLATPIVHISRIPNVL